MYLEHLLPLHLKYSSTLDEIELVMGNDDVARLRVHSLHKVDAMGHQTSVEFARILEVDPRG